jgi:hypothetical protein
VASTAGEGGDEDKEGSEDLKPDWKDYIAIFIALLQTIFLPIVIVIIALVAFAILLRV